MVAVVLMAAIAIVLISRATSSIRVEQRRMGYTEALIWSTGILCQQGLFFESIYLLYLFLTRYVGISARATGTVQRVRDTACGKGQMKEQAGLS